MTQPEAVTSTEMCARTGCTYRQIDYWTRCRVIRPGVTPGDGSGSPRRWHPAQVPVVAVLTRLARLGAGHPAMRAVVDALAARPALWSGVVVVSPDGTVDAAGPDVEAGWTVNLARVAAEVDRDPVAVPA